MAASDSVDGRVPRGAVGEETYERVKALLAGPERITTREAFERVARESGRSVSTVQTTYYRVARRDPNTTVRRRPRTAPGRDTAAATPARGRPRGTTARARVAQGDGARLVEEFLAAQTALLAYVRELEADRRSLDAIRGALRNA
jgi:hypothetical protein